MCRSKAQRVNTYTVPWHGGVDSDFYLAGAMIAFHSILNHPTAICTGDLLSRQPGKGCWDAAGSRRLRSREHAVRRGQGSWDGKNAPGGLRGGGTGCSWRGTEVHLCSGGYCCAGFDPRTSAEVQRQQFRNLLGRGQPAKRALKKHGWR